MSAKITLKVNEGAGQGTDFTFLSHDTFVLGRTEDCHICIDDDEFISRHHCPSSVWRITQVWFLPSGLMMVVTLGSGVMHFEPGTGSTNSRRGLEPMVTSAPAAVPFEAAIR